VWRASGLIKQLLAFGRQDRFESTELNLTQLVGDFCVLLQHTLRKDVDVHVDLGEQPAYVRGDAAALENALLNLALNAQDAMPDGGTLSVRVVQRLLDPQECSGLYAGIAPGPSVIVRVSDTGAGMTEQVRERMFEPFFTTKPTGQGVGLGLAAVHGTMRNHQGTVAVHTQLGIGSSVELLLPAVEPPAQPVQALEHAPQLQTRELDARIVLADDEPSLRFTFAAMLRSAGCEVHTVGDGEALLNALDSGLDFDLIVTDLVMPGLSGARLLRALEAAVPDCPLVLITGFTGEDVSTMLSGRRRHRLLRKPFVRAELIDAIAYVLPSAGRRGVECASSA